MDRQQTQASIKTGVAFVRVFCASVYYLLAAAFPDSCLAIDGSVDINQARALKGGVSGGDAPGFPVTLSQPGLYRLTGNLDVRSQASPENVIAIEVAADDVTVDLNGFALLGPTGCSTSPPINCSPTGEGAGVNVSGDVSFVNTVIKNGTARGFGNKGVRIRSGRIERVQAMHNGFGGLSAAEGEIVDSGAIFNRGIGIYVGKGAIRRCQSSRNAFGIFVGSAHIEHSVSDGNESNGIAVEDGSGVVDGCHVLNNHEDGIVAGSFFGDAIYTIRSSVIRDNAGAGIRCGSACTVTDSTIRFNDGPAIQFDGAGGYARNVMTANNGGGETQVSGGTALGPNVCGSNATCP